MTDSTRPGSASIAFEWWRRLNPSDGTQVGAHRAALARMRRAATPIEVMQEPEALHLIARLPRHPDRVATLAGVLAFVRESDERPVARTIGRASLDSDEPALLSEGRFRRLLQTKGDELLEPMRRLVRMTRGTINVRDLSTAVLYWGEDVRKRWILEYYNVAGSMRSEGDASTTTARTHLEQ